MEQPARYDANPDPPPAEVRDFIRRLSGNEYKILTAIHYLAQDGTPTTMDAIAAEAMINRATVYRTIPRMSEAGYTYATYHLTDRGRAAVNLALTPAAEAAMTHAQTLHNIQTGNSHQKNTDEYRPQTATRIAPRDGLTVQNATQVATDNTTTHESPQGNQVTTKVKGNVNAYRLTPEQKDRALSLARSSAKQLGDEHSLGLHVLIWQAAIAVDTANGNDKCYFTLSATQQQLKQRRNETGQAQGAAWNKRTKHLFAEWGVDHLRNRSRTTAPAGNDSS